MSLENPQLEDGFTPVANSIMEALARTQLSGCEWRALLFLLRKTYGWSKKSDRISLSQFVDGTGINQRRVIEAINRLISKNIIHKVSAEKRTSKGREYQFNKHYGSWVLVRKSAVRKSASAEKRTSLVRKSADTTDTLTTEKGLKDKDCAEKEKSGAPLFEAFLKVVEEPETKPDRAIQVTTSVPYLLASWFYSSRGIPANPTPADMHYAKQLLQFYPETVIKNGVIWRLSHDPDGYWTTHITIASTYRQFGNWMAESSVKAISLRQWIQTNPDMDFERFTDPLARADGFMRAFNEAKRNRLVYFEDADYAMYKKAIRIKTSESKAETKEARRD